MTEEGGERFFPPAMRDRGRFRTAHAPTEAAHHGLPPSHRGPASSLRLSSWTTNYSSIPPHTDLKRHFENYCKTPRDYC